MSWARNRRREICSSRGGCTRQGRVVRPLSNSSGTVGNGLPAPTPLIPDSSFFPARWASTTASLCPVRWSCGEALVSPQRVICAQVIATSTHQQRVGSLVEYVWRFELPLLSGCEFVRSFSRDGLHRDSNPSVSEIRREFVSWSESLPAPLERDLARREQLTSAPISD
jgi:hypothetical protein